VVKLRPPTIANESYELLVFILGESPPSKNMFCVTAKASDSVAKLKKRPIAKSRTKGIDVGDLTLWMVLPLRSFPFIEMESLRRKLEKEDLSEDGGCTHQRFPT
jgi:hypothetical protein